jgi:hypothetical protein
VTPGWLIKALAASIPLLVGALVTLAWQNSHTLAALTHDMETMRLDLQRISASLEPGRTIQLRLDRNEQEIAHLRDLVERPLMNAPPDKP